MFKRSNLPRLVGLGLFVVIIWRLDSRRTVEVLADASLSILAIAFLLNLPQVALKALRWRWMLKAQGISYGVVPSSLAYFGSIFIGLLTPGRLGEFIKAVHVNRDCGIPSGRAFSSVLADRLFDLYALMIVGGAALISLGLADKDSTALAIAVPAVALVLPMVLLLNSTTFGWTQTVGNRFGKLGRKLLGPEGWVVELRDGLKQLTLPWATLAVALTVLAYTVFYMQAYLLALAMGLDIGVVQVSYAVALGSLITLIPISISGLGTREAAIVAYLGITGVTAEAALGFSLLVFLIFYIGGALLGAGAWLIKPVPWKQAKEAAWLRKAQYSQ